MVYLYFVVWLDFNIKTLCYVSAMLKLYFNNFIKFKNKPLFLNDINIISFNVFM